MNNNAIKYVALEMIFNKPEKYEVHAGLFKGIHKEDGDTFISIQTTANQMLLLNLADYNILTLESMDGSYKSMNVMTEDESDQKAAMKIVEELYKNLLAAGMGMVDDSEVIDVKKYVEVPGTYDISDKKVITTTTTTRTSCGMPTGNVAGNNSHYNRTTTYTPPAPKEIAPTFMKRTVGKKPTKAQLAILMSKLDQIAEGTYEPELPPTAEGVAVNTEDEVKTMYPYEGHWGECFC